MSDEKELCPMCGTVEPAAGRAHVVYGGEPDHRTCIPRATADAFVHGGGAVPELDERVAELEADLDKLRIAWTQRGFRANAAEAALINVVPVLECAMDLLATEQDRSACLLCDLALSMCKCSDMRAFRAAVWPHHSFRPSGPEVAEATGRCTYVTVDGQRYCDSAEAWHPPLTHAASRVR